MFGRYGYIVARHPLPFIIVPVLLTLFLSTGIAKMTIEDDLRFLYSPINSPSRWEYQVHKEFTGDGNNSTWVALSVESIQTKSLLTQETAAVIRRLNNFVLHNLTFTLNGKQYLFGRDLCPHTPLCPESNIIVEKFFEFYWSRRLSNEPLVKLKYPVMEFYRNKFFLPAHLYGVTVNKTGDITAIEMVHLVYVVPRTEHETADVVGHALEKSLTTHLVDNHFSDQLHVSMFSVRILNAEIHKNTTYTAPYLTLTALLLLAFTVGSCMTADWLTSKPIEAVAGVISSSLAIVASTGLMFHCGVPFISQVAVMPFLALAIGVDDAYVMLGAWQETNRRDRPERRLSHAMREAGGAITVTSITDVLSFAVGSWSTTPAISIFCKFVAVSILFDYCFQITFFAGVMALGGRRESNGKHSLLVWQKMDTADVVKLRLSEYVGPTQDFFANVYAPFLCKASTRIGVLIIYVAYLALSIYGCTLLRSNMTPSELLVDDSPMKHYLKLTDTKIWTEGLMGRVYVTEAPDFIAHPQEILRFLQFVTELETTPYSIGSNSTQLWLREFVTHINYFSEDPSQFYTGLQSFLRVSFNRKWASTLRWAPRSADPQQIFVKKFFFTTGFRIADWRARTKMLAQWRNITKRYPDYQALVFDENNFYGDQMLVLPQTALSSLGQAAIAMTFVCAVFIGNLNVVFWVTFTMLSMDVGIAGFLALWGAELSPTTVVNILMSIGLSIDFSSHTGYRIHRSVCKDPNERMREALGSIGWPVMQGGISTFLAIVVMLLVHSHVVRMFARTVILVVVLGAFHGVVLLPILLRTFTLAPVKRIAPSVSCRGDAQGVVVDAPPVDVSGGQCALVDKQC